MLLGKQKYLSANRLLGISRKYFYLAIVDYFLMLLFQTLTILKELLKSLFMGCLSFISKQDSFFYHQLNSSSKNYPSTTIESTSDFHCSHKFSPNNYFARLIN